jgi:dienelactone hydrolase
MQRIPLLLALAFCSLVALPVRAADTRAEFLTLIKHDRVPLTPMVETWPATNGVAPFHFSFATQKTQRVFGVLIKDAKARGRQPVVIALHGTGGSKTNLFGLCRKLATNGFIGVTIDARYHGERRGPGKSTEAYQAAIAKAWRDTQEHPLYYDTVWDVMRLVDYLQTRKDVDAKRIGLIGISKGGIESYLVAAADPRIAVAVPCLGVQSFLWALEHNTWPARVGTIPIAFEAAAMSAGVTNPDVAFVKRFYDRVVPGIYAKFDGPAMLPLIAPRPLLVINGDSDNLTPLPGLKECTDAAQQAYVVARAEDRFAVRIQENTGHQVTADSEQAAIEWFVRWLRP